MLTLLPAPNLLSQRPTTPHGSVPPKQGLSVTASGHAQAGLGGLKAKLGNRSHAYQTELKFWRETGSDFGKTSWCTRVAFPSPGRKEAMPRGNPQIPLDGRRPACGLHFMWHPEPATHVHPNFAASPSGVTNWGLEGEERSSSSLPWVTEGI